MNLDREGKSKISLSKAWGSVKICVELINSERNAVIRGVLLNKLLYSFENF